MGTVEAAHVPFRLDGKIALVTGSGRGIGASIAVELARQGAKVVVNYSRAAGPAEKVVQEIKALGSDAIAIKADVSNVNDTVRLFEEAVAHFGKLDIVSSNAGVVSFGHLEEVTPEEFDRVFNINTRGQFFVAREGYKHLNNGGRIILTSSNTARGFVVPKHAIYSGSKGSIESFVPVLAKDCGSKQITVNAVAPGGTVTDMFHDVAHHYIPGGEKMTIEQLKEAAAYASPLHRCGYPLDVAHAVCFLASKEAEWINGKVLPVDGGAA
ncbi:versicolorin reductase [Sphaerulina musiva SO2202]|uniref:Versicolorin reductase n=1 Tax=Sphaerulina musiva (strain SO2202) TaxID=692275 RepID=N1QNL4_SPHMS|nr:versicolorin reductase [Sphaerulina musiva SO2202]EMF17389.1 versicolorin reductase [Sphaerulina musiva SO2202]